MRRLAAAIVLVAAALVPAPSLASFRATTGTTPVRVATTSLGAPTGFTASVAGLTVTASATAGSDASGYQVGAATPTGASATCATTASSYAGFTAPSSGTWQKTFGATYNGYWACLMAQSTYTPKGATQPSWTSVNGNPTQQVRLGLVPTGVSLAQSCTTVKGTTTCTSSTITLTFNQQIADPGTATWRTDPVCFAKNPGADVIVVGDPKTTGCAATDTSDIGVITGFSLNSFGSVPATATRGSDGKSLIVTLTTAVTYIKGGTGTFRASSTNKVTTPTDTVPICSTTGSSSTPDCTASVTGSL